MTEISSCYFCGTALDAPVESYSLLPGDLADDEPQSVSLCPTCRRKLATVLGVVLEADAVETIRDADDGGSVLDVDTTAAETVSDAHDGADGTAVEVNDVDPETDDAPTAGEPTSEPDEEATATTETSRETGAEQEVPATAADQPDEDGDDESADNDDVTTGGDAEEDPEEAIVEEPSILSTPAAKKIVRLLQNREFPVDREQFQVVAANAYEISRADCTAVLDELVADGYVDERDGRLVRPEG